LAKVFKRIRSFSPVAASVGLILALLAGSVVSAKAEPAEERVVKIGLQCSWTGTLASTAVPLHEGQLDYIRWLNEQGGISGIKVEGRWEDTRGIVPAAISAHKRLVEWGEVIEANFYDAAIAAVLPRLARDEIPCVYTTGTYSSIFVTKPRWVFGSGPIVENILCAAAEWMQKNWTEKRPLRLGIVHADVPAIPVALKPVRPYLTEREIEFVGTEVLPMLGVIDSTTELLRMAAKEPDWLIVAHYGGSMVTIVKDIARLELQKRGVKLFADPITLDEPLIKIVGKAAEGWYKTAYEPTPADTQLSMMKPLLDAAKRYRGHNPEDVPILYFRGWIGMGVICEAVRIAIEEVGLENLNGRAVRDAFVRIKDFDTGLGPPITITEDKPFYNDFWYVYHIEKGELRRIDRSRISRVFHYVIADNEVRAERL